MFTYEVCDDGVEPGPLCDTATVTIVVIAVNDAPAGVPQSVSTDEDTALALTLTGTDVDVATNSDVLTFSIVAGSGPSHGVLSGLGDVPPTSATVTYTPDLNYNGPDSFEFQVCDSGSPAPVLCDTATVTITVVAVNDAPTADDQSQSTDEDVALALTLTGSDVDVATNSDSLTFSITSGPSNGGLSGLTDVPPTSATVDYTPDPNYHGPDSFEFEACDTGSLCATGR